MIVVQQGDVVFVKVEQIPEGTKLSEKFDGVVQHGEVTGHAHRLSGKEYDMYEFFEEGRRYLRIKEDSDLSHEEHHTIKLPKGDYEVRIVREMDHFAKLERPVVD